MNRIPRVSVLSCLSLLGLSACPSSAPTPFAYLNVIELSDEERIALHQEFESRIAAAFADGKALISAPVAVVPPGDGKDTAPGPATREIRMPVVDYATGESYVARLGADRQRFVLETLTGAAPLSSEEADRAFQVANADASIQAVLEQARGAGYHVEQGAMSLEPSDTCPGRCVDVRFLGFGQGNPALYSAMSIVAAQVSLGLDRVVSSSQFSWQPAGG